MDTYKYEGPVMKFEHVITSKWTGYTKASSPAKARANLTYRAKMELGLVPEAKISLEGEIEKVI